MRSLDKALINRDFARLWYGLTVSTVGDYVFDTTLVLWIATVLAKGKTWAPAAVSGVMLSVGVAVLVVGPVAGVFVDRWDRRGTMLRTEVIRGVLVAVLTVFAFLPAHVLPTWAWLTLIFATVIGLNAAGQFFGPARMTILGDIVPGEADRARAAGLMQATASSAAIIGPPLAAPLLFTVGLQWALLLNALSYGFSYFAIRSIRLRPAGGVAAGAEAATAVADRAPAAEQTGETVLQEVRGQAAGFRAELTAGLRFFAGNRFLVALLAVAVICQCGTGALNALDIFFVTDNLHAAPRLYGYLGTALAIGSLAGALLSGAAVRRFTARTTVWLGLMVGGLLVIGYARQGDFAGGLLLTFLFAIPFTMLNTALTPLLLAAAPREYLGRVIAVFGPANQAASMLSVLVAGWLASTVLRSFSGSVAGLHFGPIDTIFTVSGLLIVAGGCYAVRALPASARSAAEVTADAT